MNKINNIPLDYSFEKEKFKTVNYVSIPPPDDEGNPFLLLLGKWLSVYGWKLHKFNFNIPSLIVHRKRVEVCYFHWPETIWRSKNLINNYIKAIYFLINCKVALWFGYRLVWSAHNQLPHTYRSYHLEVYIRKFILRNFNLIIGHAENTYNDLKIIGAGDFSKKYVLAEHGYYEDYYKPSYVLTRKKLNITDNKLIVLFKISNKDYQGIDTFINIINQNKIPQTVHFLVFGAQLKHNIASLAGKKNITHLKKGVNNKELSDLMEICDYVLMPYKNITTSGFYFLAMTFHKPVIAPDIAFFVRNSLPGTALLYNKDDAVNAINAILKKISEGQNEINHKDFDDLEIRYNWKQSAFKIASKYQNAINS